MNVDEYVERIHALCQERRYAEALALSEEQGDAYWDVITAAQMQVLERCLHHAALVAGAARIPQTTEKATPTRPR